VSTVTALVILADCMADGRFPTLMAIDEAQCLFTRSTFRAPDYSPLESYHLSAPRLALDYISGAKSFVSRFALHPHSHPPDHYNGANLQNRGSVLLSLSNSTPFVPIPITLSHALKLPSTSPITPYTIHDPVHLANASKGLKTIEIPWGMSQSEASGIWQIWSRKGWARGE
jgi:small subunit ribosomal protein S29